MGATYDDLLAVARRTEETGFDAFFRSDHYLTMGGDGLPGPTDAWVTLAGPGPGDQPDPARHADDGGHLPAAGPAGDLRGAGRPDERRPGRAGHRRGLVRGRAHRLRDPLPVGGGALRPATRSSSPSSPGCGTPRRGRPSTSRASTTSCPTHRPAQAGAGRRDPDHRRRQGQDAHAAAGRAVRRGVQRAVQLGGGQRPGRSAVSGRPARRPVATRRPWSTARRWCLRGQGRGRARPPGGGHRPRGRRAARHGVAGTPAEAVDVLGRYARPGRSGFYLQVLDLVRPRPPRSGGERGRPAAGLIRRGSAPVGASPATAGTPRSAWAGRCA